MSKKDKTLAKDNNIRKIERGFELLTDYTTVLENITAKCKVCGFEDTKTARTFLRSGCTNCKKLELQQRKIQKLNDEDDAYLDRINDENEYVIHKYREDPDDILEVKHVPCGQIVPIENRYIKEICKQCHPGKLIDADWYREKYDQLKKDGYEVLDVEYGEYNKSKGRTTTIKLVHEECGTEFTRNSLTLKQPEGHLCPLCVEGKRIGEINEETIQDAIQNILGEDYEYHSGLIDSIQPFKLRHKPCGTVYTKRLSSIRIGSGECPVCKKRYKVKRSTNKVTSIKGR